MCSAKPYFTLSLAIFFSLVLCGQDLEYLTPVLPSGPVKDTSAMILSTVDLSLFTGKFGKRTYSNSLQIIDADQSWPPAWYASTPVYTREMFMADTSEKRVHINFTIKPEIGSGYISVGEIAGVVSTDGNVQNKIDALETFFILNKQLSRVDTIKNRAFNGAGWSPGFRKKPSVELLSYTRIILTKDMSGYSKDPGSDSVSEMAVILNVVDGHNKIKFAWNAMEHLDPRLFNYKQNLDNVKRYGPNNNQMFWYKFTSINWDYDGNILYALKDIGIGKISRTDGTVIWQLNSPDMTPAVSADSLQCISPVDFKFLYANDTAVFYSFYEKGQDNFPIARGVIFQQDKRTLQTKLVKYYVDRKEYGYCGQGAFDYNPVTGNYLIGYGACESADTASDYYQDAFEYGRKDSTYAIFQVPKSNIVNGVHRLENWPRPPRPTIIDKGTVLEAKGEMAGWTWYKLEGPHNLTVTRVGNGKTIKPERDGVYVVVGKHGIGYAVSKAYRYEHNAPY